MEVKQLKRLTIPQGQYGAVSIDLSGFEAHRRVCMSRVIASSSLGSVMVIILALEWQEVMVLKHVPGSVSPIRHHCDNIFKALEPFNNERQALVLWCIHVKAARV